MTVDTNKEGNYGSRKGTEIFLMGWKVRPQTQKLLNIYMHLYVHDVRKKRTSHLLKTIRELISTVKPLNPPHYQPNSWMCSQRLQSS